MRNFPLFAAMLGSILIGVAFYFHHTSQKRIALEEQFRKLAEDSNPEVRLIYWLTELGKLQDQCSNQNDGKCLCRDFERAAEATRATDEILLKNPNLVEVQIDSKGAKVPTAELKGSYARLERVCGRSQ